MPRIPSRVRVVAGLAVVGTLAPLDQAFAQRVVATIYGAGAPGSGSPNVVVVHNLTTGQTELSQPETGGGLFTSDGRYALITRQPSSSAPILELFDTATRAITRLSVIFTPNVAHTRDVSGPRVQLAWALPASSPAATGYVLEAGSAPGRRDLAVVAVGPGASLDVPVVPTGRS